MHPATDLANEDKVRPFSSEGEYRLWLNRNCHLCLKHRPGAVIGCNIDKAITQASDSDGLIPAAIYERMKLNGNFCYHCPEIIMYLSMDLD